MNFTSRLQAAGRCDEAPYQAPTYFTPDPNYHKKVGLVPVTLRGLFDLSEKICDERSVRHNELIRDELGLEEHEEIPDHIHPSDEVGIFNLTESDKTYKECERGVRQTLDLFVRKFFKETGIDLHPYVSILGYHFFEVDEHWCVYIPNRKQK